MYSVHTPPSPPSAFPGAQIKRSNIDILMNNYLLIILAFLFTTVFLAAVLGGAWHARVGKIHPYLAIPADESSAVQGIKNFFTFLILFSALIPISLYVSVEMVKVGHALFIDWDIDMYEKDTDTPAKVRSYVVAVVAVAVVVVVVVGWWWLVVIVVCVHDGWVLIPGEE